MLTFRAYGLLPYQSAVTESVDDKHTVEPTYVRDVTNPMSAETAVQPTSSVLSIDRPRATGILSNAEHSLNGYLRLCKPACVGHNIPIQTILSTQRPAPFRRNYNIRHYNYFKPISSRVLQSVPRSEFHASPDLPTPSTTGAAADTPHTFLTPPSLYLLNPTDLSKPHALQQLHVEMLTLGSDVAIISETWYNKKTFK